MMYRRSATIEAALHFLSTLPQVTHIGLQASERLGLPISAVRLRFGSGGARRSVLLVGGLHARELVNPDLLVEFIFGLLEHYTSDWTIGLKTWPASKIREVVDLLDLYILPNANPDGRERVLNAAPDSNFRLWRKNLRLLPYRPYPDCWGEGVDLNRNFAHLWGIRTLSSSGSVATSTAECSDQYVGPSVASEAETKNVRKLLDEHPIDCLIDLHSYGEFIFHPWAHAAPQTTDPTQRFFEIDTSSWYQLPTDAPHYREYLPLDELERFQTAGLIAAKAIRDVRAPPTSFYDYAQPNYRVKAAADEYPSTGSGMDYAYARHLLDPSKRRVHAFAFETGAGDFFGNAEASFQPAPSLADRVKQEVMSGLLSMLESCALGVLAGAPHSVNQAAWFRVRAAIDTRTTPSRTSKSPERPQTRTGRAGTCCMTAASTACISSNGTATTRSISSVGTEARISSATVRCRR